MLHHVRRCHHAPFTTRPASDPLRALTSFSRRMMGCATPPASPLLMHTEARHAKSVQGRNRPAEAGYGVRRPWWRCCDTCRTRLHEQYMSMYRCIIAFCLRSGHLTKRLCN
ncbi:hypothetical protein PsYK624_105770 [Phanerochaete sordida]|uniref:Uncharacterized protein n=1 Tax=Phanerochaete sordida TaxID=48140 RepID=A0A9P3LH02_9APHY|nr:hypothetical protein PsYK624_105770 [Phanerochaete sordida]